MHAQTGRAQGRVASLEPGIGLGLSVGVEGFGGDANRSIRPGVSADLSVRYGTSFGLLLYAGGRIGRNALDSVRLSMDVAELYIEPRFALVNLSSRWAPFVSVHVALSREQVRGNRIAFSATGHSVAGGGGAFVRLTRELSLEGGVSIGLAAVGDYHQRGDYATYLCTERLDPGTSLPAATIQCGDVTTMLPVYSCYPPFSARLRGDCDFPKITRADSGRSGSGYRVWLGMHVSLGTVRGS